MKIALLGYGKEGQAAEKYFTKQESLAGDAAGGTPTPARVGETVAAGPVRHTIDIFKDFNYDEIAQGDYSSYDIILRSPSVPPLHLPNESSLTRYFFDHCPCPIIGVTATKGKGTTCSFIKALLDAEGYDAYLVGNIGTPAIEVLDQLTPDSVVVYEMSSFQLWDLPVSPHIAVVGIIEPDHLNVHKDFADYISAKSNIARWQTENDCLIYYSNNPDSRQIAENGDAIKIPYPFDVPAEVLDAITLPGRHNRENAIAAIAAVASLKNISPDEYLREEKSVIMQGLSSFHGLPHRLEFLRELNGVKYYDDNFSTNVGSTKVAINAFPDDNVVAIIGGRDKTDNADLPELYEILQAPQVKKVILIGESGHELAHRYQDPRFELAESLEEAVSQARAAAEKLGKAVVLMSPAAASFDMFKNVYDRGDQFKSLICSLAQK